VAHHAEAERLLVMIAVAEGDRRIPLAVVVGSNLISKVRVPARRNGEDGWTTPEYRPHARHR
jgi:hypothetical protein